jgi:hypothetical protein
MSADAKNDDNTGFGLTWVDRARATWPIVLASFLLHVRAPCVDTLPPLHSAPRAAHHGPRLHASLNLIGWLYPLLPPQVHSEVDALLFMPFMYSRIQCCPPIPAPEYDVDHPGTLAAYGLVNVTRARACELPALAPSSALWSHSARCPSLNYVRDRAQAVLAVYSPVRTAFTLLMFPAAGALADTLGRKPVLLAAGCGPIVAAGLFWVDVYLKLRTNAVIYCCSAVLSLGRLINPLTAAMLADIVSERDRASCFPVRLPIRNARALYDGTLMSRYHRSCSRSPKLAR